MLYSRKATFQDHVNMTSVGRKSPTEAMLLPEGTLFLSQDDRWLVKTSDPVGEVRKRPPYQRRAWLDDNHIPVTRIYYEGHRYEGTPSYPLGKVDGKYRTVRFGELVQYFAPSIKMGETFVENGATFMVVSHTKCEGCPEYPSSNTILAVKVSY